MAAKPSIADGIDLAGSQSRGTAAAARRRGKRGTNPATADVEYSAEQLEVLRAVEAYRQSSHRQFLTTIDTFRVILSLGYRKP